MERWRKAAGKAVRRKNCFFTQSTFTAKSEEHDGKYLLSVVAIPLVLRGCMQSDLLIVQEWVCRRVKGMENAQRIMLLLVKVYLIYVSDGNCKLGIFFVLKMLMWCFWLFLVSKKYGGKCFTSGYMHVKLAALLKLKHAALFLTMQLVLV